MFSENTISFAYKVPQYLWAQRAINTVISRAAESKHWLIEQLQERKWIT